MAHPIEVGDAISLGVIQGLTEFLPVSSDGHLAAFAIFFGMREMSLTLVVLLHAGTLLATLAVFGKDLWALTLATLRGLSKPRLFLATKEGRQVIALVAASVPTAVIGLLLEDAVEHWAAVPWIVGVCLIGSAMAVFSTRRGGGEEVALSPVRAAFVGVAQGLAVLPGLSRSASTIAAGMLLGLRPEESFRFSFLLSIPAVAGAIALKLRHPEVVAALGTAPILGAVVAFVVGLAALLGLARVVRKGKLWAFAIYLVPFGATLILYGLFR